MLLQISVLPLMFEVAGGQKFANCVAVLDVPLIAR